MRSRTYKKNFWFNEEEKELLATKSALAGMNESEYLRKVLLGYELKEKPDDRFYEVMRTMRNTANNLNQIAKKANSLGFIDVPAYKNEIEKLDNFIDKVKDEYLLNGKRSDNV